MSKKVSKIILICAIAIIIPIAIVATVMSCSNNNSALFLTVKYSGTGTGKVEGLKEEGYKSGEKATLTAVPDISSDFIVWLNGDEELGKTSILTLEVKKKMTITAKFDKKVYEVSFVYDNGTDGKKVSIKYGDKIEVPTKQGYAFDGWEVKRGEQVVMTLPAEETTANFKELASGELTLTAKWIKTTAFTLNYGEGYTPNENDVKEFTLRDGQKFGDSLQYTAKYFTTEAKDTQMEVRGWQDADGNKYTPETVYSAGNRDNLTLNAIWVQTYKVSFKVGQTEELYPTTYFLAVGDDIKYPSEINKKGYVFNGKFKVGATEFNSTTLPADLARPITIEIVLELIDFNIEYTGLTADEIAAANLPTTFNIESTNISLTDKTISRKHYDFINYTYNNSVIEQITKDLIQDNWTKDSKLTIVANLKAIDYSIEYQGLTAEEIKTAGLPEKFNITSADFSLADKAIARKYYDFVNYTNGNSPITVISKSLIGDDWTKESKLSIKANYTPIEYTISYSGLTEEELATLTELPKTVNKASTVSEIGNMKVERNYYTFKGYFVGEGENQINVTAIGPDIVDEKYITDKTITIKAVYEAISYSVTYDYGEDWNSQVSAEDKTQTYTADNEKAFKLKTNVIRNGFILSGWEYKTIQNVDGTDMEVSVTITQAEIDEKGIASFTKYEAFTLYAKWILQDDTKMIFDTNYYTSSDTNLTTPKKVYKGQDASEIPSGSTNVFSAIDSKIGDMITLNPAFDFSTSEEYRSEDNATLTFRGWNIYVEIDGVKYNLYTRLTGNDGTNKCFNKDTLNNMTIGQVLNAANAALAENKETNPNSTITGIYLVAYFTSVTDLA